MWCRQLSILAVLSVSFLSTLAKQDILSTQALGTLKRYTVGSPEQLQTLSQLAIENDLDVWHISPEHVDIYYPPNVSGLTLLDHYDHSTSYIDPSPPVRSAQEEYDCGDWNLTSLPNSTFHDSYHPLYEIDQFIYDLVETFPDLTRVIELGHSAEGREMFGLAISNSTSTKKKMAYYILGAQHAREWVATAAALYTAHALVADPSEAFSLRYLLDSFDFYIVPVPNPDGYAYTWETDRFWYKNRMITSANAKCIGLDTNRNWGYKWRGLPHPVPQLRKAKKERIADPCSNWYPGTRPFQAPETNNIANFVSSIPNAKAFMEFRSYGQKLSSPYSYTCKRYAKDAEDQLEAAMGAVSALRHIHGTSFAAGPLCQTLYEAPGNAIDWMYARAGIKYSYAAHLRDTGTYGFSLPSEWIRPVGEETAGMVEYIAKFIITRN